ncbi:MAG: nitrile hydratase accessory protein [Pseudomonadota bacterium]
MLPLEEPDRPFTAPWHAQLFATTHALAHAGAFNWPDWADHFGQALADAGAVTSDAEYYEIWLESFERFLVQHSIADADSLATFKAAWTDAYLRTPHGEPVERVQQN